MSNAAIALPIDTPTTVSPLDSGKSKARKLADIAKAAYYLPAYEYAFPNDKRPRHALETLVKRIWGQASLADVDQAAYWLDVAIEETYGAWDLEIDNLKLTPECSKRLQAVQAANSVASKIRNLFDQA